MFRAVDRERLLGRLTDAQTAIKRRDIRELLSAIDLAAIEEPVLERAAASFSVNVRALDAIHVATAEVLATFSGERLEFRRVSSDLLQCRLAATIVSSHHA